VLRDEAEHGDGRAHLILMHNLDSRSQLWQDISAAHRSTRRPDTDVVCIYPMSNWLLNLEDLPQRGRLDTRRSECP